MARLASIILVSAAWMASFGSLAVAAQMPLGCFSRTYDTAHLRIHHSQQVQRLWIRFEESRYDPGKIDFGMNLWVRSQKQIWRAGGRCKPSGRGLRCQPDTDGASELLVTLEGRNLRLTSPGKLKIFDDVTGPDLNERLIGGSADSTFLLQATPDAACKDARP
ncbi:hypothetical protein DWF00_08290 [Bosea caraganae]|uniref:DUF3617 family protein n=1 Tax=Bosea caraganae TaxID=2763117 RepID=A0A370LAM3_9HYPH|nr:hypothetical protein [Bosea caraganae]RDJ27007.1 hypothetical protein DWF00_08290 [Bosea caraganae]RDJ29023.1 hypothetical protein DWE98_00065 [Bosea caraganae]